jgi:diphthine synthase
MSLLLIASCALYNVLRVLFLRFLCDVENCGGMFTLVGLGLGDMKDITVRGLEAVRTADVVFLEAYTSFLIHSTQKELEDFYQHPVVIADREMVESGDVLAEATTKNIVLLVVGDVFGATTHSDLMVRCREQNIPTSVIHNASIINAVGCCGLQLYRFGQVLSLCFWSDTWRPDSFYERLLSNRQAGVHTLLLLDIKVKEVSDENLARGRKIYEPARYMTICQAIDQLVEVESYKKGGAIDLTTTTCVGLARVGSATQQVVAGTLEQVRGIDFGAPLHSLIIAGDVHECEEDYLNTFRVLK